MTLQKNKRNKPITKTQILHMIPLLRDSKVVKFLKTGSRIVVARACRVGKGELSFNEYITSVL